MNIPWRVKRQLMYLAVPIVPALLIGAYMMFGYFTTASCTDGRLNQGEQGIDCEGPCPRICMARVLPLQIKWSNVFPTLPGTYNIAAAIDNRNEDIGIEDAGIKFSVYSEDEELLYENTILIDIRPSAEVIAFDGPVKFEDTPSKVVVSFDVTEKSWEKTSLDNLVQIPRIITKEITGSKTEPRVEAVLHNVSDKQIYEMPVAVLIYDETGKAVAASSTETDISPESQMSLVYTWPRPFPTTSGICQQPVDVVLAIDASGSMNSISENPPQPLADVKIAAKRFIGLFSESDQLGVVSFANDAQTNQILTTNLTSRISGVDSVVITAEAEVGYTNIAAALRQSKSVLSNSSLGNRGKAVILLTDGLPTAPDGSPDPELESIAEAKDLIDSGINLFAIGLGEGVNQNFLNRLVQNDKSKVFQTSSTTELSTIYSQIASAVCIRRPYKVEIYPNPGL